MKLLKVILFVVLFCGVERFCHKQTGGFSLRKILPRQQAEGAGLQGKELQEVESLLNQPFHYFAKGGQCYIFASADGSVVIKFFKQHHMHFWNWLEAVPLPGFVDGYRKHMLSKHQHQSSDFVFESCRLADERFKERTGMIYLHVNRTDCFKKKLLIVDKLGIEHQLDPNEVDFAVQKRAEVLSHKKLKRLIKEKKFEMAKQCIDSLVDLIAERSKKGIKDLDPNFRSNFGFLGEKAIEIDIGSYQNDNSIPMAYKTEVIHQTRDLKEWLNKRNAELARYLDETIEAL